MSLSHGILGFLSYGKMTGYELAKAFHSSVNFCWHAQTSQIYLELGKLEKKHMVGCELVLQSDKPNKKVYHITYEGKQEFLRWLDCGVESLNMKNEFLLKIFFSGSSTPGTPVLKLRQFISDCQSYLSAMDGVPRHLIEQYKGRVEPAHTLYWDFAVDFMYSYMNTCIQWAERCISKLEENI